MTDGAFVKVFRAEMGPFARQTLADEIAWIAAKGTSPTVDEKQAARERVEAMDDETVMKLLEATAPKLCSECGR